MFSLYPINSTCLGSVQYIDCKLQTLHSQLQTCLPTYIRPQSTSSCVQSIWTEQRLLMLIPFDSNFNFSTKLTCICSIDSFSWSWGWPRSCRPWCRSRWRCTPTARIFGRMPDRTDTPAIRNVLRFIWSAQFNRMSCIYLYLAHKGLVFVITWPPQ